MAKLLFAIHKAEPFLFLLGRDKGLFWVKEALLLTALEVSWSLVAKRGGLRVRKKVIDQSITSCYIDFKLVIDQL
ncbi:hypothetical protein HQN89_11735 [Paenibacillus frigoriresistens]|uniref:hypothetical protein n=1 Tax=Paenibacillus alginolyticus TaxID=59839 RepID=UPI001567541E|nr:hypothetical protein [Paenibacillus frigoriresistens]NRF91687.1 hypothetical protein [Paenibacillus frigoriresistens]